MILITVFSALLMMVGGAVFYRSFEALEFALGVLLSSAFSAVKILMLEHNVKRILDMDNANSGQNYIRGQYLLRYALTGVVLVIAALVPFISVWGAVFGVLTMQIAVIAVRFMKIDEDAAEGAELTDGQAGHDAAAALPEEIRAGGDGEVNAEPDAISESGGDGTFDDAGDCSQDDVDEPC